AWFRRASAARSLWKTGRRGIAEPQGCLRSGKIGRRRTAGKTNRFRPERGPGAKMKTNDTQDQAIAKAVIYCRVSSVKQTVRGDGLASQETRCREFAKYKGY